ncbi:MAG: ribosome maturation factor RimM [Bacillota bacterium]|jgi:16S rRNA processing protein RimM|nr:ribosome maturation factor RimM [Bacillota bacterium]NLL60499.1 16S rRNA processing protein RimM [Tissierellia bacterium]
MDYIKVGKIVNTHGIKGYVKCIPMTDDLERFRDLKYVYTEKDDTKRTIDDVWDQKGMVYLKLKGIDDMGTAEKFKDTYISILKDQLRQLPEDSYYLFDLEGMDVYSSEGDHMGKISQIYQTAANDVYEVKDKKRTFLIPAIKDVVKSVNIQEKKMVIDVIEGLLE